jgi:FtsP/CotA-like multicopper oxidase with cupredoxin domain
MIKLSRRSFLVLTSAIPVSRAAWAQVDASFPVLSVEKASASLLQDIRIGSDVLQFRGVGTLPILRAKQGQPWHFRLVNGTDEDFAFQLLGVRGPVDAMNIALPAKSAGIDVKFTPPDAGTYWLSPMTKISEHRDRGLSAMLIVEEVTETGLLDVPVILDDWIIADDGKLDETFGDLERAIGAGRMGNWFTVNRAFKPRLAVPRQTPLRLRVLNVANMRTMNVSFRGAGAKLLALDGQPLAQSQALGTSPLQIAPGQRADVLVEGLTELAALVLELGEDAVEIAFLDPVQAPLPKVTRAEPYSLPPNPVVAVGDTPRIVPIVLEGGEKGGLQRAEVGFETLELRKMLELGLAWAMNGIAGFGGPALFTAKRGETLALEIENRTNFEQVLGVQGHVWRLVELNGEVSTAQTQRDTVVIPVKAKAKLLLLAENPGGWLLQSLHAERADSGLMVSFRVE